jgi:pyruvate,orthophosphate dikinase
MAAAAALRKKGKNPIVEVMIPLTVNREELELARGWVQAEIDAATKKLKNKPHVTIGTMIETPRAAVRADQIAEAADFFSFGTNDLTQLTFGFSRDDVESRMMPAYLEQGLLKRNPFETIDVDGVGELVKLGAQRGRQTKPGLKLGVCGEPAEPGAVVLRRVGEDDGEPDRGGHTVGVRRQSRGGPERGRGGFRRAGHR